MFATIYVPNFYLQAAMRHQPRNQPAGETPTGSTDKMSVPQPAALIEKQENKLVIIQLNHAAKSAGVRKGMTPSQALARCLRVVIKTRERAQEKSINEILIQHAFTLSPFVEATALGVCTIQFAKQASRLSGQTGFQPVTSDGQDARLPGQAGRLSSELSRVIEQLANCEISAQAGIAPLPDASFLAAHLARPILEIDDAREFLAPLPIEVLQT
jgi:nucleotidyltransferase/DNA polymerase involved in DNA repair